MCVLSMLESQSLRLLEKPLFVAHCVGEYATELACCEHVALACFDHVPPCSLQSRHACA